MHGLQLYATFVGLWLTLWTVSGEFTYGYETDEFTLAYINLTYVDSGSGKIWTECEEVGKFGTGRVEPVSGLVVHASSNNHTTFDACEPLDGDLSPGEPWIALVQHGRCRDSVKLRHVAATNASAVVVYSSQSGSRLVKLHHRVLRFIAIFITQEKGQEITALVNNGTRVMMYITVGTHTTLRYANINRTSVLFVSISFIILMVISLAWLVFYYVQRFRYIHAKDILSKRLCSAAKKALDQIPVKTLKPNDVKANGDYECCPVCIDAFKSGEVVRTLPCGHAFHKACVDPWLLEQRSCPMCKMDILMYYGLVFTGSQESVINIFEHQSAAPRHGLGEEEILHVTIHEHHSSPQASSSGSSTESHSSGEKHSACSKMAIDEMLEIAPSKSRPSGEFQPWFIETRNGASDLSSS